MPGSTTSSSHAHLILPVGLLLVGAVALLTAAGDQLGSAAARWSCLLVAALVFAAVQRLDRLPAPVHTFMWVGVAYTTVRLLLQAF